MKKNKLKNTFFEELKKVPIILVAAEKAGISRNSVYRWRKEDTIFAKEMDKAIIDGISFVNDISENQVLVMIKEKNWCIFWKNLEHSEIIQCVKEINKLNKTFIEVLK